jgi:hypothetical protein
MQEVVFVLQLSLFSPNTFTINCIGPGSGIFMSKKVILLGGGISGISAVHELVGRGLMFGFTN